MSLAYPKSEFMFWSFDHQIASEIQANENQANETLKNQSFHFTMEIANQSYTNKNTHEVSDFIK